MSPVIPVPDRLAAARVTLRPLRDDDVPRYVAAFAGDPALGRDVGLPRDPDKAAARATVASTLPDAESGTRLVLAVAAGDDDTFLGMAASQGLAARLGFTREARQIQRNIERGRRVDVIRFGVLREEWPTPGS